MMPNVTHDYMTFCWKKGAPMTKTHREVCRDVQIPSRFISLWLIIIIQHKTESIEAWCVRILFENVDICTQRWKSLSIPSAQHLRSVQACFHTWKVMSSLKKVSQKPFLVSVEGNIGSGKSTMLKSFNEYPEVTLYPEPVAQWWVNCQRRNASGLECFMRSLVLVSGFLG